MGYAYLFFNVCKISSCTPQTPTRSTNKNLKSDCLPPSVLFYKVHLPSPFQSIHSLILPTTINQFTLFWWSQMVLIAIAKMLCKCQHNTICSSCITQEIFDGQRSKQHPSISVRWKMNCDDRLNDGCGQDSTLRHQNYSNCASKEVFNVFAWRSKCIPGRWTERSRDKQVLKTELPGEMA